MGDAEIGEGSVVKWPVCPRVKIESLRSTVLRTDTSPNLVGALVSGLR
jgi:hypothetical protein